MEPGYTPTMDTTSKPTSDDQQIIARPDSMLDACLRRRRPLLYSAGPDADDDRPTHVRAGSGLAWLGGRLCVVQDDANFLALCDLSSGAVEATALPRGAGDRRLFDETLGNKPDKLDLEACVVAEVDGVEVLLALGSGSTSRWEHVALVHLPGGGSAPVVRMIHAPALYTALRQRPELCGSELNIEGAVLLPSGHVRLFQRGNGAPGGGLMPVDATCDLPWDDLWSYLQGLRADAPSPEDVTQYALGQMQGVRLTFCDATLAPGGRILYLAGAEESSRIGSEPSAPAPSDSSPASSTVQSEASGTTPAASRASSRRSGSATTATTPVSASNISSSRRRNCGLIGTASAPARSAASNPTANPGWLPETTATV